MCTLIILRRPDHAWPLLLAGNRDEMSGRPSLPPARHWPDRPNVVAGLDELAGGSWLGVNDDGVCAVAMNREGSLGPETGKRSRGELVLEALDHAEASEAAQALGFIEVSSYRPFNLFIGDPVSAYWICHDGSDRIIVHEVPDGLHMLSARELDDETQPRIRRYLPRFRASAAPWPVENDWKQWPELLADGTYAEDQGPHSAMNLSLPNGFVTRSSHMLAIPHYPSADRKPIFRFADGRPHAAAFSPVII